MRRRRQRTTIGHRIGRDDEGHLIGPYPRQARQRQSQTERRVARDGIERGLAEWPSTGLPFGSVRTVAALNRQYVTGGSLQIMIENAAQPIAIDWIVQP